MAKIIRKPATVLYPLPVVLVSCGTGSGANIITLAWAGTLCSNPPLLGLGVRPSRHSHALIKDVGEFVVNLPRAGQVRLVDHCGMVSGQDEDKWVACGFTPVSGAEVEVPLIAECPINIECRLRQTISLGSHDFFVGEVVSVQMDEGVLDDRGRLDVTEADPFAYLNGDYRRVGELLGTFGFSKRR
ncbi:MAG: flavin reductase family protein, partial [Anaerolineae bacterium]|jgi:flavin reductase (DIM6/NTAB) family NADH-FMN oxidoreductase RutF